MGNPLPMQAVVISQAALTQNSAPMQLALFNEDGSPAGFLGTEPAANQADTVAVDLAALKVDFNALLDKLKVAGLMVADA